MSAILELKETPKSCGECPVHRSCDVYEKLSFEVSRSLAHGDKPVRYNTTRHPDCPLKITEDNLRWDIEYTKDTEDIGEQYRCPKCGYVELGEHNYCPDCGQKLLPSLEEEENE